MCSSGEVDRNTRIEMKTKYASAKQKEAALALPPRRTVSGGLCYFTSWWAEAVDLNWFSSPPRQERACCGRKRVPEKEEEDWKRRSWPECGVMGARSHDWGQPGPSPVLFPLFFIFIFKKIKISKIYGRSKKFKKWAPVTHREGDRPLSPRQGATGLICKKNLPKIHKKRGTRTREAAKPCRIAHLWSASNYIWIHWYCIAI